MIYFLYRWFLAVYFSYWLSVSLTKYWDGGKALVTFNHWCSMLFVAYLVVAALSMAVTLIRMHAFGFRNNPEQTPFKKLHAQGRKSIKHDQSSDSSSDQETSKEDKDVVSGHTCAMISEDETTWYQKLQWILFTVGSESTFAGVVLYWILSPINVQQIWDPWNKFDVNMDFLNGLVALLDVWISGKPVRLLQFLYLQLYFSLYIGFIAVYCASVDGDHYGSSSIDELMENKRDPVIVSVAIVVLIAIYVPAVHFLFYVFCVFRCCFGLFGFGEQQTSALKGDFSWIPLKCVSSKDTWQ